MFSFFFSPPSPLLRADLVSHSIKRTSSVVPERVPRSTYVLIITMSPDRYPPQK